MAGVVAAVVSLAGSWIPSVWADEGASVSAASRTLPELLALVQRIDAVHAVYYVILQAWFGLVPVNEFWLRFPSAVAVGVSAALLLRLALRWVVPGTAVVVVLVFALLPRVTWMGIEGRSSAISSMLALAATLVLVRALDRPGRWGAWLGYGLLMGLGVAVHIYLVFLVCAHAVSVWWCRTPARSWLRWLGASVLAGVLAAPVVLLSAGQTGQINAPRITVLGWGRDVAVNQFFLGQTPGPIGPRWWQLAWQGGAVGLALLAWVLVACALWRERRQWRAATLLGWAVPWVAVPPILVLVWSVASKNMYHPRYFAFCAPAMALLIGVGISGMRRRWGRVVALVLVAALALPVYVSQRGVNAKSGADWSQVASLVEEGRRPGDGVYFCASQARRMRLAYPSRFGDLVDVTMLRSPAEDASLGGASRPLAEALASAPATVWAICRLDDPASAGDAPTFTAAGYRATVTWRGTQTQLVRYQR